MLASVRIKVSKFKGEWRYEKIKKLREGTIRLRAQTCFQTLSLVTLEELTLIDLYAYAYALAVIIDCKSNH